MGSPLAAGLVGGLVGAVVAAVLLLITLRHQRRLLATTGWPAWRAEAKALPRSTRRTVERAVRRGGSTPPELAGLAARHAEAVLEVVALQRERALRRSTRRWFVAAVVFGVAALAINTASAVREPSAFRVLLVAPFIAVIPLWVLMARGHDFTARHAARVRTARDLAARQLAEDAPTPVPPAQRP